MEPTKRAPPKRRPAFITTYHPNYGSRIRKKRAPSSLLIGIALDITPSASNNPLTFVLHCDSGNATFVDVRMLNSPFGVPVPVRIRFPFDTVGGFSTGAPAPVIVTSPVAGLNVPLPE